nr:PREDICTED: replication protein A 70 kDa DNA-binding subunit C-like [Daucus carota subsp. sativus]
MEEEGQLHYGFHEEKLQVRITHMWDTFSFNTYYEAMTCLIMIDVKNDQYWAITEITQRQKLLKFICPGLMYHISNFRVVAAPTAWKPIDTDKLLIFGKQAEIHDCLDDNSIPRYKFNLCTWSTVMSRVGNKDNLTDIAGVIMFVGGMETERNINRVNITLLDGRLAKLRVTLWGVKATQFEMNFNLYRRKNVVLIITGLLVTKTQGIIHLTSTQATTIFYNPQYNEVRELAQNIANTFGEFICPVPCTVVSQQTGEQNMQPPYLALKELRASRLWVHQKFRTNGDIIDLVIHKRKLPAFCIGCTADESTYGDKFHCAKCGRNSQAPLHTHSLALVVSDTSGYAKLILKPYEVHQLTGSSPNEVYKRRRVVNKKATLPAAMEILRGSQCSFVVKLTPFPYTNAKGEIEVVSVIHYTKIIAP